MSCLLQIPEELLELIVLSFHSPRDLLRLALTCKCLYATIVPFHLNFIDISTDFHNSTIWEATSACPKLAARIRKLEVLDEDSYHCALQDGYKSGLRLCPPTPLPSKCHFRDTIPPPPARVSYLSTSLLRSMSGLTSLALKQRTTQEALYDMLSTLSDPSIPLRALSIVVDLQRSSPALSLPCEPALFHHLTSFSLTLIELDHLKPAEAIFDYIIFQCPSLINLSLVSRPPGCFCSQRFFKQGNWPSLRRLTLFGWLNLYPQGPDYSGANVKLAIAFFQRHPLLESLWIASTYTPHSPLAQEIFLHRSAFPSLRSLCVTDQTPIQLLDQLHHMEDLEQIPLFHLSQAKMLRSCTFAPRHLSDLLVLAREVPHLNRLVFSLNDYTPCAIHKIKPALCQMKNLTHLVIEIMEPQVLPTLTADDFHCVLKHLPDLKFFQLSMDADSPWYIIERERDKLGDTVLHFRQQPDSPFADYHYQRWGDFFVGSLIDSYV